MMAAHRAFAVGVAPAISDLRARAGEVVEQTVTVINTETTPRSFQFFVTNFTPGKDGDAIFDGGAQDDLPSWMRVEPSMLLLDPNGAETVTVRVSVPPGARPGAYYAAIFFGSATDGLATQAAHLLFLTIEGPEIREDAEIVSVNFTPRWASSLGAIQAEVRVQNSGTVYVKPDGELVSNALIGGSVATALNPNERRVLPGATRVWEAPLVEGMTEGLRSEWRPFAVGPVNVLASMRLGTTFLDARQETVWVWPWRTGALVAVGIVIVWGGMSIINKRKRSVWPSSNASSE